MMNKYGELPEDPRRKEGGAGRHRRVESDRGDREAERGEEEGSRAEDAYRASRTPHRSGDRSCMGEVAPAALANHHRGVGVPSTGSRTQIPTAVRTRNRGASSNFEHLACSGSRAERNDQDLELRLWEESLNHWVAYTRNRDPLPNKESEMVGSATPVSGARARDRRTSEPLLRLV